MNQLRGTTFLKKKKTTEKRKTRMINSTETLNSCSQSPTKNMLM